MDQLLSQLYHPFEAQLKCLRKKELGSFDRMIKAMSKKDQFAEHFSTEITEKFNHALKAFQDMAYSFIIEGTDWRDQV